MASLHSAALPPDIFYSLSSCRRGQQVTASRLEGRLLEPLACTLSPSTLLWTQASHGGSYQIQQTPDLRMPIDRGPIWTVVQGNGLIGEEAREIDLVHRLTGRYVGRHHRVG